MAAQIQRTQYTRTRLDAHDQAHGSLPILLTATTYLHPTISPSSSSDSSTVSPSMSSTSNTPTFSSSTHATRRPIRPFNASESCPLMQPASTYDRLIGMRTAAIWDDHVPSSAI